MSADPASTRNSIVSQIEGASPARQIAAPYAIAARTIARPWWCTCDVQPEVAVASMLPTVSAV